MTEEKQIVYCKYCGKPIEHKKGRSLKVYLATKYCSRQCHLDDTRKTIKCKYCKKEITVKKSSNQIYCDENCMKMQMVHEWTHTYCAHCGKEISDDTLKKFGRLYFCSNDCFIKCDKVPVKRFCHRCGNPLYSDTGNIKKYEKAKRHMYCADYK